MLNNSIFIQLASYRDPELVPTIDSLLKNAKFPDNLHICIAFQYSDKDAFTKDINKYRDDTRFTIIDIPYNESKGACWARNLIQQKYNNEKYTLQLDSHHRFTQNWDVTCIDMLEELINVGYDKPLLTSYIPSYDPKNDPKGRVNTPWGMSFDRFTPEGVVFFLPYYIEDKVNKPIKARFFSAHFCFTLGIFAKEVQHDPEYYFHGEEITLAVRAYTHGYDLFHPHKVIGWHEYTRVGRTKQWDDDSDWGNKNTRTHRKVRSLLNVDGENEIQELKYGLGNVRTLQQYQTYAGINFTDRSITENCKKNIEPPGNEQDEFFQQFRHPIGLHHSNFPEEDYTFCAIIFEDKDNKPLHRVDLQQNDLLSSIQRSKNGSEWITWQSYQGPKPHHIVIWPYSESKGWCEKQIQTL